MNNLKTILSGVLIGTGVILPGVSGSVLAIMLGIYDKVIYLLNDKNKKLINKFIELLPLLIGIVIGIIVFGNIILKFINKYEVQIKYIFIGLILGGVPILKNEIKQKNEKINYKLVVITFICSLVLFLLPSISNINTNNNFSFLNMFLGGFLYISGKIIPGISSSFFLMILGLYNYILGIMSNPLSLRVKDLINLIPFILGVLLGFLILIKLINYLLNNHFTKTYSIIIGFVLGSIIAIFPGFYLTKKYIISVIMMVLAFSLTYKLSKISKN